MNIKELRNLVAEISIDPNKSIEQTIKNEKKIYDAVMSISLDDDSNDSNGSISEVLNLLIGFPVVLQLIYLMARESQCSNQNPDFSVAPSMLAGTRNR